MKNIVVIPNFKQDENQPNQPFVDNCINSWKSWCDKHDVKLFVIEDKLFDFDEVSPQMQKMWSVDVMEHNDVEYDQIAQVDYDTFILPHCPNFFEMTNDNFSAVLDNGFGPSLNMTMKVFEDNWFSHMKGKVTWDTYFNSGFIVFNKKQKCISICIICCIAYFFHVSYQNRFSNISI